MTLASGAREELDAGHGLAGRADGVEGDGGGVGGDGAGILAVDGLPPRRQTGRWRRRCG